MKNAAVNKIRSLYSILGSVAFILVGALFLVFAVKAATTKIPDNFVTIEATVTEIRQYENPMYIPGDSDSDLERYEYKAIIEYTYDGKTYSNIESPEYDSSMNEGDTLTLYINPDNPEDIRTDSSGAVIFIVIGAVILLAGVGGLGYSVYKKIKSKEKENTMKNQKTEDTF